MSSVINLCFHGIGRCVREREPGEARYWISPSFFHAVLDEVAGRDDISLSFDDGNRSDVDVALPALLERGLKASFFVVAGRLVQSDSLGPEDLRQLHAHGMEIGNHGMTHVAWVGLDAATAKVEIDGSADVLAEVLDTKVDVVSVPLGRYDSTVVRRVRAAGYRRLYTSDRLPSRTGSWLQPRFSLRSDDSIETLRRQLQPPMPVTRLRGRATLVAKRYAPAGLTSTWRSLGRR